MERLNPLPAYVRLPSETSRVLSTIRHQIRAEYQPVGLTEIAIADRLALNLLRQRRLYGIENQQLIEANKRNETTTAPIRQNQQSLNALLKAFDEDSRRLRKLQRIRARAQKGPRTSTPERRPDPEVEDSSSNNTLS